MSLESEVWPNNQAPKLQGERISRAAWPVGAELGFSAEAEVAAPKRPAVPRRSSESAQWILCERRSDWFKSTCEIISWELEFWGDSENFEVTMFAYSERWKLEKRGLYILINNSRVFLQILFHLVFLHHCGDQKTSSSLSHESPDSPSPYCFNDLKLHWRHSLRRQWQSLSTSQAQPQRIGGLKLLV